MINLKELKWLPLERTGSYLAEYNGTIFACPMHIDGSMDIEEACECEDWATGLDSKKDYQEAKSICK